MSLPVVRVVYTRLPDASPDDHVDFRLGALPTPLADHIRQYRRPADRGRAVAGYTLVGLLLEELGWSRATLAKIRRTEFGRPYLPHYAGLDFNISHSGSIVVCAAVVGCRVGVDVERVRPIDLTGFGRFFAASEWRGVQAAPDPTRAFFDHWTMKESVLKGDGRGLTLTPERFAVVDRKALIGDRRWHLQRLPVANDHAAHLATDARAGISIREVLPVQGDCSHGELRCATRRDGGSAVGAAGGAEGRGAST